MKPKWCKKCVLPDSRPNLIIDKFGICNVCNLKSTSNNIKNIKPLGKKSFKKLLKKVLKNNPKNNYDCLKTAHGK